MSLFAGLDWGSTGHAVCVLDEKGGVVARLEVRHDAAGLADLLARLKRLAAPAGLPVAIERPSGLVVESLLAAGHPVVPIHPNVVKACRPCYRAAGGKSDPGDAYMLADILRTDGHRFAPLTPVSDAIKALRAMVRGRDDLVAAPRRLRQPAPQPARGLLGGRRRDLRRARQPDRARLPGPLPDPGERPAPRGEAPGRLPGPAPLLGTAQRGGAARAAARRAAGSRR